MAAVSNSLIGIYLKQFFYVADQVADFVNFYGFTETASSLGLLPNATSETKVKLTKTFNEYGYVTLGITWLPGKKINIVKL